MILVEKNWHIAPTLEGEEALPMAQRLLSRRGLSHQEAIEDFLASSTQVWHDPFLLPDMAVACDRIRQAVMSKEKILIYGDYDCDGVTSTAILILFFRRLNANCQYIIPDRMVDGYGMSKSHLGRILESGASLVITVDCGVANVEEVALLKSAGLDVIITDHHEVQPILPEALAIINPKRPDCPYPFKQIAGVGVALKLIAALCSALAPLTKADDWVDYLDITAIGTIGDVVSLIDENRFIVKSGLARMQSQRRPGIGALCNVGKRPGPDQTITGTTIAYSVVPKINAAGRMGDATRGVELLITEDVSAAKALADILYQENLRRQEIEAAILQEAITQIEDIQGDAPSPIMSDGPLLVQGQDWHPGVIGIVASRLVTRYGRPAIVFTADSGEEGELKGSGRSCGDYNLFEAITHAQEYTRKFGGHPMAAGLAIGQDQYTAFASALLTYAHKDSVEPFSDPHQIDIELTPSDLTLDTCRNILELAPFGQGNREPKFLLRECLIQQTQVCGNGKHLKIQFTLDNNQPYDAIAFGIGHLQTLYVASSKVDLMVGLDISSWQNKESVSIQVMDIRFSKSGLIFQDTPAVLEQLYHNKLGIKQLAILSKVAADLLLPDKESIKVVYKFLKTNCDTGLNMVDLNLLARWIAGSNNIILNPFVLARILDIFDEAGLIKIHYKKEQRLYFSLLFVGDKVKLENTTTFQRLLAEGALLI